MESLVCRRCGQPILDGQPHKKRNLPEPNSVYHANPADCGDQVRPSRAASPDALAGLADALARLVPQQQITPEEIADIAEPILDRLVSERMRPADILITWPDGSQREVTGAHYLMPRLVRLLAAGIQPYLWGPAGSGKTTAALQAAGALGRASEIDTLDPSTPKSSILGYRTPTGEPVQTAFSRCWTSGSLYIADEADNAPAYVQTLFNSALANGHAPMAWGLIPRHDAFGFVATANTPGKPTPMFPDRRPISAAFADRLYFLHWPLDPAIECRAGGLPIPEPPARAESTCTPSQWVSWVLRVRTFAAEHIPALMITPRASLIGLVALAAGETPLEAAHGLIFRGASSDIVAKVLSKEPLPC